MRKYKKFKNIFIKLIIINKHHKKIINLYQ
jgi:hypothetical protein